MNKLKKPVLSFSKLFKGLLPGATLVAPVSPDGPTSGLSVVMEKEFANIYLLTKGYAHVKRSEDGVILYTIFAPFTLGFSLYPGADAYYTIELGPESELYQSPRRIVLNTIKRDNLLREWMTVVSYKMAFLYERDRNILNQSSEFIVYRMLTRLMGLPPYFRDNISIYKYVEERTCLSRSSISRIVSKLKNEGTIVTEGGRLINIKSF